VKHLVGRGEGEREHAEGALATGPMVRGVRLGVGGGPCASMMGRMGRGGHMGLGG
jgi:hypothetical protein